MLAQPRPAIHGDDKQGGAEVIIWRQGVKLRPFFRTLGADFVKLGPFFGHQGRTLVVWQKLAKSFLFHARPFEVGRGGGGGGKKSPDLLLCSVRFFAFFCVQFLVFCSVRFPLFCSVRFLAFFCMQFLVFCSVQFPRFCSVRFLPFFCVQFLVFCFVRFPLFCFVRFEAKLVTVKLPAWASLV